jgi:hypothetical protein
VDTAEARVIPLFATRDEPGELEAVRAPTWEQRATGTLSFLSRRLRGDYAVDEYGFDAELTEHAVLPVLRTLYEKWFRVEVNGVENIPDTGGALLVANHAGGRHPRPPDRQHARLRRRRRTAARRW